MPRIPFVRAQGSVPATSGNVFMPMNGDPVAEAIGYAGKQLGKQADDFGDYLLAERKAEQRVQALTFQNGLKDSVDIFADSHKDQEDYENWFDADGKPSGQLKSDLDKFREENLSVVNDDGVRRIVSPILDQQVNRLAHTMRMKKAQILSKKAEDQFMVAYENSARDAAMAGTPEKRQEIEDRLRLEGQSLYSSGLLKKSPEKLMIKFKEDTAKEYFLGMKNSDPVRAYRELNNPADGTLARNLDPVLRQQLITAIEPRAKEQKQTAAVMALLERTNGDNAEAVKLASDPKFMQEYGFDLDDKDKIINSLENNIMAQDRAYRQFADEKMGEIHTRIVNHQKVTAADYEGLSKKDISILEEIRDRQADEDRREAREKRSLGLQAASLAKQDRIEKSNAVYGNLMLRILSGDPVDNKEIYTAVAKKGMAGERAGELITMKTKISGDPKYALGLDVIKNARIPEAEKARATIYFKQQVDSEGATGKRSIDIAEWYVKQSKTKETKFSLDKIFNWGGSKTGDTQQAVTKTLTPAERELQRRGYRNVNGKWVK
jgi:hypothetical protein